MSKEHPHQPCFTFTEREKLYDCVSHTRFMALAMQPNVDIHQIEESHNSFGEYLFVTLSCRTEQPKRMLTFWGLGYNEHRERWIADTWQWYESQLKMDTGDILSKEDAYTQIKEREAFVRAQGETSSPPSRRAQLYALLADFTDEDGALSELEDLDDLWSDLTDSLE